MPVEVSADRLEDHLARIHAKGQVPAAFFGPDLSTRAHTASGSLYITAPPLLDSGLASRFGTTTLDYLVRRISHIAKFGADVVRMRLDAPYLVVEDPEREERGTRLPMVDRPKGIGTFVDTDVHGRLQKALDSSTTRQLSEAEVKEARAACDLPGPRDAEATFQFGENGTVLRVGTSHDWQGVPLPSVDADGEREGFPTKSTVLENVLSTMQEDEAVELLLPDNEGLLGLQTSGGYEYLLLTRRAETALTE